VALTLGARLMDDCIFCKITQGKLPAKILHEDEDLVVFHDIRPAAPVHVLIVPREHIPTLADCDTKHQQLLGKMLTLASRMAEQLGCPVQVDQNGQYSGGFKTMFNVGPDGGQEVYHLHLHVLGGPKPWAGWR